jgi:hypothetical protein
MVEGVRIAASDRLVRLKRIFNIDRTARHLFSFSVQSYYVDGNNDNNEEAGLGELKRGKASTNDYNFGSC